MKSITKNLALEPLSQKLAGFFAAAEETARKTGFVRRTSSLTGLIFLQALLVGFLRSPRASLNQLAQECDQLGVPITPQGLHERIIDYSVEFLQAMYRKAFEQFKSQLALPIGLLQQFTRIWLVDSTFEQLPESLKEAYLGAGGKSSPASLKVQLVFEFLYGNLTQLTLEAGRAADQAFTRYLGLIQAGSLVMMDLGYFRLASLLTLAEKGAYFILRYHYPTAVYTLEGTRLELLPWLESQGPVTCEIPVRVGASLKQRIPCRLISVPVPLGVAEERRRKKPNVLAMLSALSNTCTVA